MDTRTGEIRSLKDVRQLPKAEQEFYIPMKVKPTETQREFGYVAWGEPCPCGSGKKFRKCHLWRDKGVKP